MYVTNKYDISSHKAKCVCHVACCKLGTHDANLVGHGCALLALAYGFVSHSRKTPIIAVKETAAV